MKRQLTAAIAAASIATASLGAAPANALTDEEIAALLIAGIFLAAVTSSTQAPTPPSTFSTGPILLKQTYQADFDHGNVTPVGADLWFQAVTPTKRFLTPRNGAKLALGDGSNRGFAGCKVASYSSSRIKLSHVPVGSYVCMKTSAGRISQFRMNAKLGGAVKKLKLGYTTWN